MAFAFLRLRFAYSELQPAMSETAARHRHDVIHAGYLDAINALIEPHDELANLTIEEVLAHPERVPAEMRETVRHNGGGHANHQFTWKILGAKRGTRPTGALAARLTQDFGGPDAFIAKFEEAALALEGDGWAFLSLARPKAPALEIVTTVGNGNVLELKKPGVLVCDMWAHAYAHDHGGDRKRWLDAYFEVLDWEQCSMRYDCLVQGISPP